MMVLIERSVLASALLLSVLAGLLWRSPHALGSAAAGGLLAFLNLMVLRRTVGEILSGSRIQKLFLSVALALKLGVLLATVWVAVSLLGLDPMGFAFGLSALFVGIVGGTVLLGRERVTDRAGPEQ